MSPRFIPIFHTHIELFGQLTPVIPSKIICIYLLLVFESQIYTYSGLFEVGERIINHQPLPHCYLGLLNVLLLTVLEVSGYGSYGCRTYSKCVWFILLMGGIVNYYELRIT